MRWILSVSVLALAGGLLLLGSAGGSGSDEAGSMPPHYVGTPACVRCHEAEVEAHRGSDHDLAMQEATATTVLGAFDGRELEHFGTVYRFTMHEGRYRVLVQEQGGEPVAHDIEHVFGHRPLQQYLVRFPDGRVQTLPVCWDQRPAEEGGQRWFHIYPDEKIPPGDPLHWAGPMANWNHMCADCHSTDLRKRFDAQQDRYDTTWFEIDVSCESCHGRGSAHVAWAEADEKGNAPALADYGLENPLPGRTVWLRAEGERHARREPATPDRRELETCAHCHSRRSRLFDEHLPGAPLLENHLPALLTERLYHPDGQIEDEVYVWGSFLQSTMHAKGVTCSDCHDAHSARVLVVGNGLCNRCHDPEVFDTKSHHLHDPGTEGSQCVDCHMPERTYMVVDPRRDHSMRVPRPDLTLEIGTPNACNGCHADQTAEWAEQALAAHYGTARREPRPHYGQVFARARRDPVSHAPALQRLAGDPAQPSLVRATALSMLGASLGDHEFGALSRRALHEAVGSEDPLLRFGALQGADPLQGELRVPMLAPLLEDPLRALRLTAARMLLPAAGRLPAELRAGPFARALADYEAAEWRNADTVQSRVNLGALRREQGDLPAAARHLRRATELGPWMAPAWVYLSEVHRLQSNEEAVERVLREGLLHTTEPAQLHVELGLALVRQGRRQEAVQELVRAQELAPEDARAAYLYGIALWDAGERDQAFAVLQRALQRHPRHRELLAALASYARVLGRSRLVEEYEGRLR